MGSLSIWHWLIVIVVVMLLFGRGKISDLMGDVAGGIKAFKKGMAEDDTPAKTEPPKSIESRGSRRRRRPSTAPRACAPDRLRGGGDGGRPRVMSVAGAGELVYPCSILAGASSSSSASSR